MAESEHAQAAGALLRQSEDAPGVLRLTLQRPDAFNALSEALIDAVTEALTRIAADPAVRVVVLAGAGRAFCAGHDLREMRAQPSHDYYRRLFDRCTRMMLAIQRMPQPVIARVHGIATAAGCQLVAMCDLAVAADDARFAVSGVNLGLFCSTPGVALSRNLHRKHAMEMLLTGEPVEARRALEWGLVNRVVPDDRLAAETWKLARMLAEKPPATLAAGKRAFYQQMDMQVGRAYELASEVISSSFAHEEGK